MPKIILVYKRLTITENVLSLWDFYLNFILID